MKSFSFRFIVICLLLAGGPLLAQQAMTAESQGNMWRDRDRITWPKTGVGVDIGTVSGLSLYRTDAYDSFMQGLIAFNGHGAFYLGGDYCTIAKRLIPAVPRLDPYFGFGLMTIGYSDDHHHHNWVYHSDDDHDFVLGGRLPFGVNYPFPDTPLMATAEIAPGITIYPGTKVTVQAAIKIRALF